MNWVIAVWVATGALVVVGSALMGRTFGSWLRDSGTS